MAFADIQGMIAEANTVAAFNRVNAALGGKLRVTAPYGAYRSPAQQRLLRNQYLSNPKKYAYAAPVGQSNHEAPGTALDINNWASFPTLRNVMTTYGFKRDPYEQWHYNYTGPRSAPAALNVTPIAAPPAPRIPTDLLEEEPMYIRAMTAGSAGFARKSMIYTQAEGHWYAVTNLVGDGMVSPLASSGRLNLIDFYGDDLELIFATEGIWEQIPLTGLEVKSSRGPLWGLGPRTGRVMYPGAVLPLGAWHYPAQLGREAVSGPTLAQIAASASEGARAAIAATGVKVDVAAVASAVEAKLADDFAAIPPAVVGEEAKRLSN
jgi:hypothetical protein